jgi:hypothetical protein
MWFHWSPSFIPDGELIQSPDVTGIEPISFGPNWRRAMAMGQGRTDRVFVDWGESQHPANHRHGDLGTEGPVLYEVRPVGELKPDPDRSSLPNFRFCAEAEVYLPA